MDKVVLVDKEDKVVGYAPVKDSHIGRGKHHRAFVTLLFDSKNRVILQKRKHRLFDGFWDLTAISHPLVKNGKTETYQQASDRALKKEMGISSVPIKKTGAFNYFAKDGKNSENEYCAILRGNFNGKVKPNPKEVYKTKVIPYKDFIRDVLKNSSQYTPWAKLAADELNKNNFEDFKAELASFLKVFEPYKKKFFQNRIKYNRKYPKLIGDFYRELEDFSEGGKAIRPFLVYLGYRIGGGNDLKKILPVCLALELIHSYLLIHDDIIDKSDLRRNKPTIHKKFEKLFGSHYGLSQAILAGDIACIEAFKLVSDSGFELKTKNLLIRKLNEIILETLFGEILDVEYSYSDTTINKILQVAELKTAKYSVSGPFSLGVVASSVNPKINSYLLSYGMKVGIAFSLKDDILGVYAKEETLGKPVLSDMREGKNTLLIHKAKQLVTNNDKAALDKLWGKSNANMADLKKVKKIIEDCGALEWCSRESKRLIEEGKKNISKITKDEKIRDILGQLADYVVSREK